MFNGITLNRQYKLIAMAGLLIICGISSFYIARDYQTGLVFVFWVCMLSGMGVYLFRNMTNPERLFYLFLFVIPIMNILSFSYKYILPLGGALLIFLVDLLLNKKITVKNMLATWNGRILIIYVLINFVLLPYSIDKKTSITYLVSFPIIILLWDWGIQYFNKKEKIIGILNILNFIGIFYSIIGLVILVLNYLGITLSIHLSYTKIHMYDISSAFPNTNTHGVLLAFTIPCAFYLLLESRNKIFYFLSCMLMGVNLILTLSRSSWGAAFISVVIIFLYKYKNEKIIKAALGMAVLAVVLIMANYAIDFVLTQQDNPQKFNLSMLALSGRAMLWDAAFKAIADRPLTGFGIGNSVSALNLYSANILGRTPHNTFLRMWVEMGVFGMTAYILFVCSIIYRFFKARKKSMLLVTIFAVIIGSLFQQMFETMLLGGLSLIGGYFFIFSALFESIINQDCKDIGEGYDENMLPC